MYFLLLFSLLFSSTFAEKKRDFVLLLSSEDRFERNKDVTRIQRRRNLTDSSERSLLHLRTSF